MAISGIFRHRPFKDAYLLYQLVTTPLIRLPYWFLTSLPTSWRPRRSWSLRKAILVKAIRHIGKVANVTGPVNAAPLHLTIPKGEHIKGVWVDPVPPRFISDKLHAWCSAASVDSVPIPGYWKNKHTEINVGAAPMPGEKVIYFLHGGGYHTCSARPDDASMGTDNIKKGMLSPGVCGTVQRAFSIEYRLTTLPPAKVEHPFPTALVDALAGYIYLVQRVGFSPDDIVVMGDSAGGNLALALTRYLVEYGPQIQLPKPGALILLSPWTDMGPSHRANRRTDSFYTMKYTDLIADGGNVTETAFTGPHGLGAAAHNLYISPASLTSHFQASDDAHIYQNFPRTFLTCGGAEMLRDQIRTQAKKMESLAAGLTYLELEDSIHDWLVFSFWEPERTDTLYQLGKWIDQN